MVIYKIINNINNKIYIGLTTQKVNTRFNHHIFEARKGSTSYLHRAIMKYSPSNFRIEIIDEAESIDDLKVKEVYYINYYNSTDRNIGYNISKGGDYGLYGFKHSKESILKMSINSTGKYHSEESKIKMSESRKGRKMFINTKLKFDQHNKRTSKEVIKYSLDWFEICRYSSISEACRENNLSNKVVPRSLKNKRGYYSNKQFILKLA